MDVLDLFDTKVEPAYVDGGLDLKDTKVKKRTKVFIQQTHKGVMETQVTRLMFKYDRISGNNMHFSK